MSSLSALMEAAVKVAENKPADDDRAAKIEASRAMAERLTKITEEHRDMTIVEFEQLVLGALKGGVTGHKMIMEYLVKSARLLNVGIANPFDVKLAKELKAEAKEAAKAEVVAEPVKPAKRAKK